jgi:hypothetical protein
MDALVANKKFGFGALIARSTLATDEGKTVRVTGKLTGKVYTKTLGSSLEAVFDMLEPREKYRVEVVVDPGEETESIESSEDIFFGYGECKEMTVGADIHTFRGIQQILNLHLETQFLEVGMEIPITLKYGNIPMIYRIAAINHESGHQVIFEPKWCLPTGRQQHTSNTNAGGWNQSDLRAWLNNEFLNDYLPDDVVALVKERDVICSQGSQSSNLQTAVDKIWLPREWEIFGAPTYAATTEHTGGNAEQFPIYATAANRIKTLGKDGAAGNWWESSPFVSTSADFCHVTAAGAANYNYASGAYGVAPCFHLLSAS